MASSGTYTATLEARRETVRYLAALLHAKRVEVGTRAGTRALGPFEQAVMVIRGFLDGTRVAGCAHLNLDGTVIRTGRIAAHGPDGADLWWSGKHKHHGGNVQVLSDPAGWPLRTCDVRPGREHDTTCARAATGLAAGLEAAAAHGIPALTDLGYLNVSTAIRAPVKKSEGGELTDASKQYNLLIRGVHAPAERANSLLKRPLKPCDGSASTRCASPRSPEPPTCCSTSNTSAPPRPSAWVPDPSYQVT